MSQLNEESNINKRPLDDFEKEMVKEEHAVINLWIFRIKIGLGRVENVPTIYKMPVYIGLIEQEIVTIEDLPVEYQERVLEAIREKQESPDIQE